jgi:hypothetical protein
LEAVVAQCFSIEHQRRTVGLACRIPNGFRFFAAEQPYFALDGMIFPRVRAVERAVRQLSRQNPAGRPS